MDKIDQMKEIPEELKSRILAAFAFVAAGMGMWCFGPERQLYYSTCPNETEFFGFLKIGGCFDYIYKKKEGWDKPVMLSDDIGLVWVAEHLYVDGGFPLLFLMGPVFLSMTLLTSIENALREKDISIYLRRQMSRTLSTVPILCRQTMDQYIRMLHFTLTAEMLGGNELLYQDNRTEDMCLGNTEAGNGILVSDPDKAIKGEKMLLKAITEGNMNYQKVFQEEVTYGEGFLSNTGNSLRDAKNTVLVFNALCSRAALEGGVPSKVCKEMELLNTAIIEKCDTITKLANVNTELLYLYVKKVHDTKKNPWVSKEILECCEYIKSNVFKPMTAKSIAESLGYTTYYFTKKFNTEMGVRITDYINQTRIEYAKVELLSTQKSVQEISDSLHFGNRNYFSKVFRGIVGMNPAKYREKGWKEFSK